MLLLGIKRFRISSVCVPFRRTSNIHKLKYDLEITEKKLMYEYNRFLDENKRIEDNNNLEEIIKKFQIINSNHLYNLNLILVEQQTIHSQLNNSVVEPIPTKKIFTLKKGFIFIFTIIGGIISITGIFLGSGMYAINNMKG